MAVTNIHPIKKTLNLAIDYIINENKTDGKILVSANNCMAETARYEFLLTQDQARKGKVLAHHLIQSFVPDEIKNPKQAHEIGMKLAKEILGEKHEFILSTHIDKGHVHNHIIFNSVDPIEHKHYRSNIKSYYNIREKSDKLCKEYNLNVIKNPQKNRQSKNKNKNFADKNKSLTVREKIKMDIDKFINNVNSVSDLYNRLKEFGYKIKEGKHTSFLSPYSDKNIRDYKLDKEGYYRKDNLEQIISSKDIIKIDNIKNDIDKAVDKATTINDVFKILKNNNYVIRNGETFSIKKNTDKEYIKEASLGDHYSKKELIKKINSKKISIENQKEKLEYIYNNIYVLNSQIKELDHIISSYEEKRDLTIKYIELKPVIEKGKEVIFFEKYKKDNIDIYDQFEKINIKMKNAGIEKIEKKEIWNEKISELKDKRKNILNEYKKAEELANKTIDIINMDNERQEKQEMEL